MGDHLVVSRRPRQHGKGALGGRAAQRQVACFGSLIEHGGLPAARSAVCSLRLLAPLSGPTG